MEYFQVLGGTASPTEKQGIMKAIGLDKFMKDIENASVNRARRMISRIVSGQIEAAFPMPGVDNARAMVPVFQAEILSDRFHDHEPKVGQALLKAFDTYSQMAAEEAQQDFQRQLAQAQSMAQAQQAAKDSSIAPPPKGQGKQGGGGGGGGGEQPPKK